MGKFTILNNGKVDVFYSHNEKNNVLIIDGRRAFFIEDGKECLTLNRSVAAFASDDELEYLELSLEDTMSEYDL